MYGLRVTPGFFAALGTRVIAGRDFDEGDTRDPQSKLGYRSAIVNESFARRYFAGRNPIGYRLGIGGQPDTPTNIEIVGVIEDFSYRSLRLKEIRAAVADLDPALPLASLATFEDQIDRSV